MYCPNCGTQNEDGGKFCVKCGAALPSIQPQGALPTKPQVAGMACHYPGCTEPVIGQCPGYKGSCLRFYCATHSVEPYCSVCVEKIARDAAIQAIYEDYLQAAKKVPSGMGWLGMALLIWSAACLLPLSPIIMTGDTSNNSTMVLIMALCSGIGFYIIGPLATVFLWLASKKAKQNMIAEISKEKPGFSEFYSEYEKQKRSETMAAILTGLLVAGAAAKAIDDYRMRQDVRALVREMKK